MASFTKLNDDNIVVAVLEVHDDVATDEMEQEKIMLEKIINMMQVEMLL